MLAANQPSSLIVWSNGKLFTADMAGVSQFLHMPRTKCETQFLYILSDDEIQEGDYVLDEDCSELFGPYEKTDFLIRDHKKVIASTDPSLNLPSPSPDFLHAYCEEQPEEVLVRYTVEHVPHEIDNKYFLELISLYIKDNTISIIEIKKSYTL